MPEAEPLGLVVAAREPVGVVLLLLNMKYKRAAIAAKIAIGVKSFFIASLSFVL